VALGRPRELADEEPPAPVPKGDLLAVVTTGVHVVEASGDLDPVWSAHRLDGKDWNTHPPVSVSLLVQSWRTSDGAWSC